MIKLEYTEEQKQKCKAFAKPAHKGYRTSVFKQNPKDAMRKDYLGKLGEFALYNFLKTYDKNINEPDTTIINNPTFNSDLLFHNKELTIKTDLKDAHLNSWLFKNGEIKHNKNKIFAGLVYKNQKYSLMVFDKFNKVEDYLTIPASKYYEHTHSAIYYKEGKMGINRDLIKEVTMDNKTKAFIKEHYLEVKNCEYITDEIKRQQILDWIKLVAKNWDKFGKINKESVEKPEIIENNISEIINNLTPEQKRLQEILAEIK